MNVRVGRQFSRALSVAVLALVAGSDVALGQPAPSELRPNLRPFAPSDLAVVSNGTGGLKLVFSTTSWNNGLGPLEIRGKEPVSQDKQNVYQRVYLSDGSFYDRLAGMFDYHDDHAHVHMNNYALYTLQPVDAPGGSQRTGEKTSFCLLDNVKVDTRLKGAAKKPVYTICDSAIQGISVGWGDRYRSELAGQSVDITDNPPGDYELSIEVDPKSQLLEIDEFDNTTCVRLRINGTNPVQVLGQCDAAPAPNVTITAVDPPTGSTGSSVLMTITGSGFADGMAVGFENGSGTAPAASDVQVLDGGTRITATVFIRNGKVGADPVWDVRVGPAVLQSAFTVTR